MLTAKESSELTGNTKAAIIKAIKSGRLSAKKNDRGEWRIDKAELLRVYPDNENQRQKVDTSTPHKNSGLQAEIEVLQQERERERRQLEQTIEDLRRRLDESEDERRKTADKLTGLLTHQQEQKTSQKLPEGRMAKAWAALTGKV